MVFLYVISAELASEGGNCGDRPRPRSDRCTQTGKNFMDNEKTKFAVMVGPRPRALLTPPLNICNNDGVHDIL
jgi:hypothetical protein